MQAYFVGSFWCPCNSATGSRVLTNDNKVYPDYTFYGCFFQEIQLADRYMVLKLIRLFRNFVSHWGDGNCWWKSVKIANSIDMISDSVISATCWKKERPRTVPKSSWVNFYLEKRTCRANLSALFSIWPENLLEKHGAVSAFDAECMLSAN